MNRLTKNLSKIKGKTVLLRVDLNEEVNNRGKLVDDFRLQAIVPTINVLLKQKCKIVVVSHRGRPEGRWQDELSLRPIAKHLAHLLEYKFVESATTVPEYPIPHVVFFEGDISSAENRAVIKKSHSQNIIVLENIRFYGGEDNNDDEFASHLAELAQMYVNDAFAVSHRAAASVVAITKHLPSFAGPQLENEIDHLDKLLGARIKKPFVLVMGGIKISDKSKTLLNLGKRADTILIGGGLANLFLAAQGYEVGKSLIEKESLYVAKELMTNFKSKLVIPKDVIVQSAGKKNANKASYQVKSTDSIFDIGSGTILEFSKIIKQAGTICWNGPMGYFEQKPFHTGTFTMAKIIGAIGKRKAYSVAGGGETVAAIRATKQTDYFDHVSTGGGAMLEYLAGKKLPGITSLE